MLKISQKQFLERWDLMPDRLKEVLFSDGVSNILWRICEADHLAEDKTYSIAPIVGSIILGFIHPEDLAREVRSEINLSQEIAVTISEEINRKIFAPIKSDLEQLYRQIHFEHNPATEEVLDLRAQKEVVLTPMPEKLSRVSEAPQIVQRPQPGVASVRERAMPPETHPPGEGPVIIHKEEKIEPAPTKDKRSLSGLFWFIKPKEKEKEKTEGIKAEIKLDAGAEKRRAPSEPTKIQEPPKPRIVHYTELKTPVSPFEGIEARRVSVPPPPVPPKAEAPKPIPPVTPAPPPVPKPPTLDIRPSTPEKPAPSYGAPGQMGRTIGVGEEPRPPQRDFREPEEKKEEEKAIRIESANIEIGRVEPVKMQPAPPKPTPKPPTEAELAKVFGGFKEKEPSKIGDIKPKIEPASVPPTIRIEKATIREEARRAPQFPPTPEPPLKREEPKPPPPPPPPPSPKPFAPERNNKDGEVIDLRTLEIKRSTQKSEPQSE